MQPLPCFPRLGLLMPVVIASAISGNRKTFHGNTQPISQTRNHASRFSLMEPLADSSQEARLINSRPGDGKPRLSPKVGIHPTNSIFHSCPSQPTFGSKIRL